MPRGRPAKPKPAEPSQAQPLAGIPECPSSMSAYQKKVWAELVRVLGPTALLTQADVWVMVQMCRAVERADEAQANLKSPRENRWGKNKTSKKVLTGPNGGVYQSPWLAILYRAEEQILRLSALLGLDPSSRMKLKVEVGPKLMSNEDPTARFFKAREGA